MSKPLQAIIGLLLAVSACLAQANPVDSTASGLPGTDVRVKLVDDAPLGFFGGSFNVMFAPGILAFKVDGAGTILPSTVSIITDSSNAGSGSLVVSLAINDPVTDGGVDNSLFELLFTIAGNATAGTTTDVIFSCFDADPDPDTTFCDYDFQPVKATVSILRDNGKPVPLPGTLPLMALGLAGLLWVRRRSSNEH